MSTLQAHLKEKNFANIYFFYGNEDYLRTRWQNATLTAIKNLEPDIEVNLLDSNLKIPHLLELLESMSFFGRRLIVVKNSGLFESKKTEAEELVQVLAKGLDDIIIFNEEKADKRLKAFKSLIEISFSNEAILPQEKDLIDWIRSQFKGYDKVISRAEAAYLLQILPKNMNIISQEINKIANYANESQISAGHIEAVASKTTEAKIFEMLKFAFAGNKKNAHQQFKNLMHLKESPFAVISMIARHFRFALWCGDLAKTHNIKQIAEITELRDFAIRDFIKIYKTIPESKLIGGLQACLMADLNVKNGLFGDEQSAEMLLLGLLQ